MAYIPFSGLTDNRLAALDKHFRVVPNQYGTLRNSGLFAEKAVALHNIAFEERAGVLYLIPSNTDSAPPVQSHTSPSKVHLFRANSHKADDFLAPQDIQGYGAFDDMDAMLKTETEELAERLENLSMSHDITEERHMSSLLQGKLLNADGTVLLDIYKEFSLTRANYTIDMALTNSATVLTDKLNALSRGMKDNAKGETITGINVYCSRTFIDNLLANANFNDILKQSPLATNLLQNATNGQGIKIPGWNNITFFEYDANAPDVNGTTVDFIPDTGNGRAFAVPTGTRNTFVMYRAPAMRLSTVNRAPVGNGRYSKIIRKPDDTGLEIKTESVFLPICKRPALLWQLTA